MADTSTTPVKTPEEKKTHLKAVRLVSHVAWLQSYRAANPKATEEERKTAWKAVKQDQLIVGRRVLKALERKGYTVTPPKAS